MMRKKRILAVVALHFVITAIVATWIVWDIRRQVTIINRGLPEEFAPRQLAICQRLFVDEYVVVIAPVDSRIRFDGLLVSVDGVDLDYPAGNQVAIFERKGVVRYFAAGEGDFMWGNPFGNYQPQRGKYSVYSKLNRRNRSDLRITLQPEALAKMGVPREN